ncbi:MAG TPA: glycoside hydrolase family 95 protein [Arenibacter sp.]|nr:glycoside hydrolase family 95 protein [Arenibacter sp.]
MLKPVYVVLITIFLFYSCAGPDRIDDLRTWYGQPAKDWYEALPLGNGRLGAMIFGDPKNERIQLNEESIWAGKPYNANNPKSLEVLPKIREAIFNNQYRQALEYTEQGLIGTPPRIRSYQPFGNLLIDYGWDANAEDYIRSLSLNNGVATVNYKIKDAEAVQRAYISAVDDIMVVDFDLKGNQKTDITFKLERDIDVDSIAVSNSGEIMLAGQIVDGPNELTTEAGKHMRFAGIAKLMDHDGQIHVTDSTITLKNSSRYSLYLTIATDYVFEKMDFDKSIDPERKCREILDLVSHKREENVYMDHDKEHRSIFERVSFDLEKADNTDLPTDERIAKIKMEDSHVDQNLDILLFQMGRYLLMNSSRAPGKLPANLQGIWNKDFEAAWNSDFHTNINLQMNYWGANNGNLAETMNPLIDYMGKIAEKSEVTAKEVYGSEGWVMHHLSNPFGHSSVSDGPWGVTPLNAAWMTAPMFKHYAYTNDLEKLRTDIYPVLKGASQFILGFMVEKDGMLVTNPSHSPENAYIHPLTKTNEQLTYSATCDIMIILETFNNFLMSAEILQQDEALVAKVRSAMQRIPKVKVGANGTIQEWIEDYEEVEPGHRHMSHLLGLYPFSQITPEDDELFEAASKTIERRLKYLKGYVGWSNAWITNMYARLFEGGKAYANLQIIERNMLLNNMFISIFPIKTSSNPIFQIDANCGVISGTIEMLMQSHNGYVNILPAIPNAWKTGKIKGIVAQNGFEISMTWKEGRLDTLQVKSLNGAHLKIKYKGLTIIETETEKGKTYNYKNA